VAEISPDGLNAFEREASQMSTEGMQNLFGKILAGEIRKPASFSVKTVRLMGQLEGGAAEAFKQLCSLSISLRPPGDSPFLDARVVSLGTGAGSNSLMPFGLSFDTLNILQEHGLVITDFNSYCNYSAAIAVNTQVGLPLTYQNSLWGFLSATSAPRPAEFNLHGVALSRSGRELLPVVGITRSDEYTTALIEYIKSKGYEMLRIATP
jgi:hypothetical protein